MSIKACRSAWVETPVGRITLIFEPAPLLVRQVLLPGEETGSAEQAGCVPENIKPVQELLAEIVTSCLTGKRREPPWDIMSREGITPLQQAVYEAAAAVPYGGVATYKDIAARIHRPRACRFVGSALAKNPFPILVPCHRVIRSDGTLGGFGGGTALKKRLIDFEARNRRVKH